MKKLLLMLPLIGAILVSNAQNVWTGTTTPTTTSGNVGIGMTTPDAQLSLYRYISSPFDPNLPMVKILSQDAGSVVTNGNIFEIWRRYQGTGFPATTQTQLAMSVQNGGTVTIANRLRIGATAASGTYANYKLSVDGDIVAKKVVVQLSNWADFVFADDYKLKPLEEVETFIKENKHLPDVPSEATVLKEGADVAEMNRILLQKVEELTLYVLDQNKKIKVLEAKVSKDKL